MSLALCPHCFWTVSRSKTFKFSMAKPTAVTYLWCAGAYNADIYSADWVALLMSEQQKFSILSGKKKNWNAIWPWKQQIFLYLLLFLNVAHEAVELIKQMWVVSTWFNALTLCQCNLFHSITGECLWWITASLLIMVGVCADIDFGDAQLAANHPDVSFCFYNIN